MRNRFMCRIVVALCLLATLIPFAIPTSAAEPDRYGYTLLTNEPQRAAYRAIAEGVGVLAYSIDLNGIPITQEDLKIVVPMVVQDYPEYFWYTGAYFITATSANVDQMIIHNIVPASRDLSTNEMVIGYRIGNTIVNKDSHEVVTAKNAFQAAVNTALAQIPAGASDYKKTEILHDYLAGIVTYQDNPDDQTAYGALVQGKAVCAGYTRAYQILLNKVGIRSFYVAGNARIHDEHLMPHAWNLLWLDGNCYYTDVTWDDQVTRVDHRYFNLSLEQMQVMHIADDPLPASCGHTKYTYHKQNAAPGSGVCEMNGSETGRDIAPYFKVQSRTETEVVYTCNIWCPGVDFNQWAIAHPELIQALGITGPHTLGMDFTESEYWVTITETISESNGATQTPNGGGEEVTPQPNTPPVNPQPSPQPVPTPTQPVQQPTEQTVPTMQPETPPTTEGPTEPSGTTEPFVPQTSEESVSTPSTDPATSTQPSAPVIITEEKPGFPLIPILLGVVVIAAGAVAVVLIRRKR